MKVLDSKQMQPHFRRWTDGTYIAEDDGGQEWRPTPRPLRISELQLSSYAQNTTNSAAGMADSTTVGTVVILACNVAAAVFPPASTGWVFWLPKVLLGIATFGITLERAKNYGLRWKFHIQRKNQYGSIIDRIDVFDAWPDAEKEARLKELVGEFARLRTGEGDIPGTEPIVPTGHSGHH